MKKRKTFKTPSMLTRNETMKNLWFDTIVVDLDLDFNVKFDDPNAAFYATVSGQHDFPITELNYISTKLKENRGKLLDCISSQGSVTMQIKTGDNVYSIRIAK